MVANVVRECSGGSPTAYSLWKGALGERCCSALQAPRFTSRSSGFSFRAAFAVEPRHHPKTILDNPMVIVNPNPKRERERERSFMPNVQRRSSPGGVAVRYAGENDGKEE